MQLEVEVAGDKTGPGFPEFKTGEGYGFEVYKHLWSDQNKVLYT